MHNFETFIKLSSTLLKNQFFFLNTFRLSQTKWAMIIPPRGWNSSFSWIFRFRGQHRGDHLIRSLFRTAGRSRERRRSISRPSERGGSRPRRRSSGYAAFTGSAELAGWHRHRPRPSAFDLRPGRKRVRRQLLGRRHGGFSSTTVGPGSAASRAVQPVFGNVQVKFFFFSSVFFFPRDSWYEVRSGSSVFNWNFYRRERVFL